MAILFVLQMVSYQIASTRSQHTSDSGACARCAGGGSDQCARARTERAAGQCALLTSG